MSISMTLTEVERETATIRRDGRQIEVQPECADALDALITRRHVAVDDPHHGYQVCEESVPLLGTGRREPNAGMILPTAVLLRDAGYHVQFAGQRTIAALPRPDLSGISHRRCDEQMIDLVHAVAEGIIRYRPDQVELAWLIYQVCSAYPRATIAIVQESGEKRRRLVEQLRTIGLDVANVDAESSPERERRIVVSSWIGLAHPEVEAEKRSILLVADARQAITDRGQLALSMMDARFRLFGLLPDDCRLAPLQRDLIATTFGFDEVFVPKHGHVLRPVRTAWWHMKGGPVVPLNATPLVAKKMGLWSNECRNRRIAKLAQAIVARDHNGLASLVPELTGHIPGIELSRTVVFVESVDHALKLATKLPDWPLVTALNVSCHGLTRQQRRLLTDCRSRLWIGDKAIVTAEGFTTVDLAGIDVVIWAGAGTGIPPISIDQLVVRPFRAKPLLVVDINDRQHPMLRQWVRRRRQQYADQGWFAPGTNPLVQRVKHFLADRPGSTR